MKWYCLVYDTSDNNNALLAVERDHQEAVNQDVRPRPQNDVDVNTGELDDGLLQIFCARFWLVTHVLLIPSAVARCNFWLVDTATRQKRNYWGGRVTHWTMIEEEYFFGLEGFFYVNCPIKCDCSVLSAELTSATYNIHAQAIEPSHSFIQGLINQSTATSPLSACRQNCDDTSSSLNAAETTVNCFAHFFAICHLP